MAGWNSREVEIGEIRITLLEAGEGRPLFVLHDELGPPQWQQWHEEIAKTRRLVMPVAPGFRGERAKWISNVTDLSRLYGRLLRTEQVRSIDVLGFSFGGWVAAEMAVNNPAQFDRMMLVAPFGIKPSEGYIADMYIVTTAEYLKSSVADPEKTEEFAPLYNTASPETIESWEDARIETAQLAWQPYMHNPSLREHLKGVGQVPTLIVWGDQDAILPRSAVEAYSQAIPGARLEILQGCGHRPEIEQRDAFIRVLQRFME